MSAFARVPRFASADSPSASRLGHGEAARSPFCRAENLCVPKTGNQTTGNDCLRQMGVGYLRRSHMRLGKILA